LGLRCRGHGLQRQRKDGEERIPLGAHFDAVVSSDCRAKDFRVLGE
jgi:hypothetical protein